MVQQRSSEVLRAFHDYCVFAYRVTGGKPGADPYLGFAFHETLTDLIGFEDSGPTDAERLFSCQYVRPGLTADGQPKPAHHRSHMLALVNQGEVVSAKCKTMLDCVTGALPVLMYVMHQPGSSTTPGQLVLDLAPDPLVLGSSARKPTYAFCAAATYNGVHFTLIAGTGDGRLYDYDSMGADAAPMGADAKLIARPSKRPFFARNVETQVFGYAMTYVIYRLVVRDDPPLLTPAQAPTGVNTPSLEVEKSRVGAGPSMASPPIISAQPCSASPSASIQKEHEHTRDITPTVTGPHPKGGEQHFHRPSKVVKVTNEGYPGAAVCDRVVLSGTVSPAIVPSSPSLASQGLPPGLTNVEFLRACTGEKGILFKNPPGPSGNTTRLLEQATHLTSRVLFHLDATSHRVHGNEAGRPQMWYFYHSGTGHGGRRVARVSPAAQEPECVAAHNAVLHHCLGDTIQQFLQSGQATIVQTGILIENVGKKKSRSSCTSTNGRNPEDTYTKFRKYAGEKEYIADRASLTSSEQLYLNSSGHPLNSWPTGTLLAEFPGREGDVHVDTQLPVDQGYVVVIVILTEHGGKLLSTVNSKSGPA